MSWGSFLEDVLSRRQQQYRYQAEAKRDVLDVFRVYTDLSPQNGAYVGDDVTFSTSLNLTGTIPVNYKGSTYNIPIRIWISHEHPRFGPLVYVDPSPSMVLKPNRNVDERGRVSMPYLTEWEKVSKPNLLALINNLQIIFGQVTPVYSRRSSVTSFPVKPASRRPSRDVFLNESVKLRYRQHADVTSHVNAVLERYSTLQLKEETYTTDGGGMPRLLLCLSGTIPVIIKSVAYNIPIVIWVLPSYPQQAPLVYVDPLPTMKINPNRDVDFKGKVLIPYLREWCQNSGPDLLSLIEVLSITFTEMPPVYRA